MVVKIINRPKRNKFGEFSKNIKQTHIELANIEERINVESLAHNE